MEGPCHGKTPLNSFPELRRACKNGRTGSGHFPMTQRTAVCVILGGERGSDGLNSSPPIYSIACPAFIIFCIQYFQFYRNFCFVSASEWDRLKGSLAIPKAFGMILA